MRIFAFCLKNSLFLNLITVLTVVLGVVQVIQMNKEAFPAVDFDVVAISTLYPGASPKEVELYVTDLLEEEIKSVDGLERVESTSIEGYSLIIIRQNPDQSEAEKVKAVNDLQRAVDRTQDLPKELPNPPKVQSINSGDMPVLELSLEGPDYKNIWEVADKLKEKIENLPDVKEVVVRGEREKEFWVEVDPKKLHLYNIGLSQVVAVLSARNLNLPGGVLKSQGGDLLVRTIGEVGTAAELEDFVIRTNDAGIQVKIKHIGLVKETFEEEKLIYRTNGNPSINMLVNKKASGDIINLVSQVKATTDEFLTKIDARDIDVSYMNDMSVFVTNRLGVLLNNGYIGVGLVLLTLLFFLSKSIAVVAAIGMPVALLGCLAVMGYAGLTINLISMFGMVIVLGMLVDDAIIVAENIFQHYERGASAWDAAIQGTSEVFWPVTATILTTVAAFSPLMMIEGIFGKFIKVLPQVVVIALAASLIEAMFVLPCHAFDSLRFLDRWIVRRNKPRASEEPTSIMNRATRFYQTVLKGILRFRYLFLISISSLLGGTLWFAQTKMELILFPTEGIESFFVRVDLPQATPLQITSEKLRAVEDVIATLDPQELKDYVTHIGIRQDDPQDPFSARSSNVGQIQVFLTPEKDRQRVADAIIEDLREKIEPVAKKEGFKKFWFSRVRLGPPVGKPVAIQIKGDDLDQLKSISLDVQKELQKVRGVNDISDNFDAGKEEFQVVIDEKDASRALLSVREVALHVRAAIEGQIATHVRTEGERIAVRVRYLEDQRKEIEALINSRVPNQAGHMVPLRRVAHFERRRGLNTIIHHDYKRAVTVTSSIDESVTSSTKVNETMQPFLASIQRKYRDVSLSAGGEYEDTDKSLASLLDAFWVALGLIFLILATQFRSLTQPFVVMMAIPFGAVGVIVAFWAHELPLSFLGMIGGIGLSGVVVNDSIVLVDFINKARERGMSAWDAAIYAGGRRFRAVWLTTLTTVFGLLPMVYGLGGYDYFLQPAAVALGYGLIFGSILVLFMVPAMYIIRVDLGRVVLAVFPFGGRLFRSKYD